jgi:hypothetical protein
MRRVELTAASSIRTSRARFLDRGRRVVIGGITTTAGEKTAGKTTYSTKLAADTTRGRLDGDLARPADVLIASAEDAWEQVVVPRLLAHGADLARVHRVRVTDNDGEALLTLPDDVAALEEALERLCEQGRTVALVILDPLSAFLSSGIDSHKDSSVRRALAPLARLAEQHDLAVLVIAHVVKDESRRLANRVSGSLGIVNASRSLLLMMRDPDDADGEAGSGRLLVHVACNWSRTAPTLRLRLASRNVELDDDTTADTCCIETVGESTLTVDDLQGDRDQSRRDVEEAILAAVANGPQPSDAIKQSVAANLKCVRRTVERAAHRLAKNGELRIDSLGFPRRTVWAAATAADATASSDTPSSNHDTVSLARAHARNGDVCVVTDDFRGFPLSQLTPVTPVTTPALTRTHTATADDDSRQPPTKTDGRHGDAPDLLSAGRSTAEPADHDDSDTDTELLTEHEFAALLVAQFAGTDERRPVNGWHTEHTEAAR